MLISEAKALVGHVVDLTYKDRNGHDVTENVEVYDVTFVPLYGPCVICDIGEVRLDRVQAFEFADYHQWSKAA